MDTHSFTYLWSKKVKSKYSEFKKTHPETRIYFHGSLIEKGLNSSQRYKTTLRFYSMGVFTQYSVSKTFMRFLKYLEGPSRHLSSKVNAALLSYWQKGEQRTESDTCRKAKLFCFHQSSYSILTTTQRLKPVPSCILNRTRTENIHCTEEKLKKIKSIPIVIQR